MVMWTVVYIAPTEEIARRVKEILEGDGVLVNLRAVDVEEGGHSTEVMVPEGEAEEAQEILAQNLGRLR